MPEGRCHSRPSIQIGGASTTTGHHTNRVHKSPTRSWNSSVCAETQWRTWQDLTFKPRVAADGRTLTTECPRSPSLLATSSGPPNLVSTDTKPRTLPEKNLVSRYIHQYPPRACWVDRAGVCSAYVQSGGAVVVTTVSRFDIPPPPPSAEVCSTAVDFLRATISEIPA